jgi:ubiquitin carboxyl-terminal hydrolase 5/13
LNPEIIQMLCDMGIPPNAAKHAVYNTGNQSADLAIGWFYENIENPICNEPLKVKKQSSGDGGKKGF